jgi:hypothetical protein
VIISDEIENLTHFRVDCLESHMNSFFSFLPQIKGLRKLISPINIPRVIKFITSIIVWTKSSILLLYDIKAFFCVILMAMKE